MMFVMTTFSLPPWGLPVLRWVVTSQSSMHFALLDAFLSRVKLRALILNRSTFSSPPPPLLLRYIGVI